MKTDRELWLSLIGMCDSGTPANPGTRFLRMVDGPWACYVCCVFGDTAKGAEEHRQRKHPRRVIPFRWGSQPVDIYV